MKKIFYFILAAIAAVSMTACANNETSSADMSESGRLSVESLSENLTTDILDSIEVPNETISETDISTASVTSETNETAISESSTEMTESSTDTVSETESAVISEETAAETTEETQEEESNSALVVYFSWSGNTESVANEIAAQTGADIFELIPDLPYTDDYDELLDIAQNEQSRGARPKIANSIDLSDYDTIFIGYPNWWADMPMIVYTFFDEYDLSGKTIAPFCTSGGSGFSGTLSTIAELEPDAEITEGLHISGSSADKCADDVSEWLSETGLLN
ncbi:MAG: flavodoxin [Ruminiclostridium sp.]